MDIVEIIKKIENPVLIVDFDHTITTYDSSTSIGVFSKVLDNDYVSRKANLDSKIAKATSRLLIHYLWFKKIKLLMKHLQNNDLDLAVKYFKIRPAFVKLFKYCKDNNIKVIICSSGYMPLIRKILEKNHIDNFDLIANECQSFSKIITPYNKNKFVKEKNDNLVVIGDNIADINMTSDKNKISIGICNDLYDYEKFISFFNYVILDKILINQSYQTSKTEIGICSYNGKKYFYKKKNVNTIDDKSGYEDAKKYYKVSKIRLEIDDYIIYEYIDEYKNQTINDYLYGKAKEILFQNIAKQYKSSIKKTLKLTSEEQCKSKKYFYDRLPLVKENLLNLNYNYLVYDGIKYNLRNIFEEIMKIIEKPKDVHIIITQGDPTDTNITISGYYTDFENGGYNSILSEISITYVSLFSHGRYFYPKYNPKAYVVNNKILNNFTKYKLDVDYKIINDVININKFNFNLPTKNKELIGNFINTFLEDKYYKKYCMDMKLLKYYICMRLLTPINVDKMDEVDKISILLLIVIIYNRINNLQDLLKLINEKN